MKGFILTLVAGIAGARVGHAHAVSWHENQYPLRLDGGHGYRCDLPPPLDPSGDGLKSSQELFSGHDALKLLVHNHQKLVRIPSVCYDDLGDFDQDERWKPFDDIPGALEESYPNVHKYAHVETVNRYGLVYTVHGSDKELAPVLLMAHQDVVPVEHETLDRWEHPPFQGHYDEDGYLWGRGASDDKSGITALMSAMEALLSQEEYRPRRTVVFAFGFDEECSGHRGAGEIAKLLEERYGRDGIAVIVDEGGAGLQQLGDTVYALPAVYEKGYLDVYFYLEVTGGHSSVPPPHTAIGIVAEIVASLESHPFKPVVSKNSPVHEALVCLARYSPDALPELTHLVHRGDLEGAARLLAHLSRDTQYMIQTSQAANLISGGQKINALPEFVSLGVNHRFAPQDSVGSIQHRIAGLVEGVIGKYDIRLDAFKDDDDYERYLAAEGLDSRHGHRPCWQPVYNGTLVLEARKKSYITPQSPTKGRVWDVFGGTVRYTYAEDGRNVVVTPGAMTGNTDSRHYLGLSQNIYRWSPGSLKSFSNIHTINERLFMSEHVDMVRFYYDFMRNYDQADL